MAKWWDDAALGAQQEVTTLDESSDNFELLEWPRVKRAVIHTRYDMVLLTAYLSCANRQLASLVRIGWILVILIAALLATIWTR